MKSVDVQGKTYPGFGRCIYCGSDGGQGGLRDEHLIPFSLGGNAVIERASCAECERKTSYIDGYLARVIFRQFRALTGIQTRHPKERPREFEAVLKIGDAVQERAIPLEDHPLTLLLPIMPVCGLLRGAQPTTEFEGTTVTVYYRSHSNMKERLGVASDQRLHMKIDTTMNLITFGRGLAKIAYCNAVLAHGIDGFRHLALPELIRGNYPFASYYVGGDGTVGTAAAKPPDEMGRTHVLDFQTVTIGRMHLLVSDIRLFAYYGQADHGMPTYRVVVGAPRSNTRAFDGIVGPP